MPRQLMSRSVNSRARVIVARLILQASCCALVMGCATTQGAAADPTARAPNAVPIDAPILETLALCPGLTVANAPMADADRRLTEYAAFAALNGVTLLRAPIAAAANPCLSSGFGPRNGRPHRGVDYHAARGAPILAAGAGEVRELTARDDFGLMVLIDHGAGVFTRYAHLDAVADGLAIGQPVDLGQPIGAMGSSGAGVRAVHLHFEVLTGDYQTPKRSFGLDAVDIFVLPAPNA